MASNNNNVGLNTKNLQNIFVASAMTTPFWYPFFSLNLIKKSEILNSKSIGSLTHTNFFRNIKNINHLYRGYGLALSFQPLYPLIIGTSQHFTSDSLSKNVLTTGTICAMSAILANPLDVAILKIQKKQSGENNLSILNKFIRDESVMRLFRGTSMFAVRNASYGIGLLVTQPHISKLMNNEKGDNHLKSLTSSFLSAIISNIFANPAEVISTMKQSPNYSLMTAKECVDQLIKKHGIRALYTAFPYRVGANTVEMFLFHYFYKNITNYRDNKD
ncbi:MAG: mitochondrial carrier protein-like protein [Dasosvirus sp.]|uniref:Mitochondrial carrier protein-like protein n=1 Tax=Dasosvirus sp. TaxID=2487764 RepID=A0A3G4ZVJ6_9VIRU|nr:MAG: mitochondrial carrier protein-like protein [Dasosvirus sp.]